MAIASLALGIGINTAVFNLVNAVLLQPLPVYQPERLMSIFTMDRINPGLLYCSYPNYKDYRDRNNVFAGLALYTPVQVTLTGANAGQDVNGQIVSGNYFQVLAVHPILGRTFLPDEDSVPDAHAVAVISYSFWKRVFGGSPGAIGAALELNNRRYTVIGVTPSGFHGANALADNDVWVPMMMYQQVYSMSDWVEHRKALLFSVFGRLKEGVTRQQAEAAMNALAAELAREYPADNRGRTVAVLPLSESVMEPNSRAGMLLGGEISLAVSALVLLIACANVANLLLVRAAARRKEMALRLALGAGRARLVRQLLTESAVLSVLGAIAAAVLGRFMRDLLWTFRPPWMLSGEAALKFDWRVSGFTLLAAVVAALVFGLAPAWTASATNLATELRERRSPWTQAGHRVNLRTMLVVIQVALSMIALTGAGLFLRSLQKNQAFDLGYDAAHLATVGLNLKSRGFSEAQTQAYYARVLQRARSLPGTTAATISFNAPFALYRARSISIAGQETGAGPNAVAAINMVEPGYFAALRIPLIQGRDFTAADSLAAPRVGILNQTMARRFWNGQNPVGARIRFFGDDTPVEIIGVAKDVTYLNPGEQPQLVIYLGLRQYDSPAVTLWVRTSGEPAAALGVMRREIQDIDRNVLLTDLETVMQVSNDLLWPQRLGAVLFGAFGALAAMLTVIGVYGVISYSVGQRTREMGIRMALGAQPAAVTRQILAEGGVLIFWGLVLGLVVSLALAGVLRSLLFGISTRDPLTLGLVIVLLCVTALAACALPAIRATRIDPMTALREE